MPIGDITYEFMKFDNDPSQCLAKVEIVDPQNYTITADVTGKLTVIAKPVPVAEVAQRKFRTEPEGDMLRIYATRAIPRHGVSAGTRGGLIERDDNFSQMNDSWICEDSIVKGAAYVCGDAMVRASTLEGYADVSGLAKVVTSRLNGEVYVEGAAMVRNSEVSGGRAIIGGEAHVFESSIIVRRDDFIRIPGGTFVKAMIRRQHEVLIWPVAAWGWITGYPSASGELTFRVGCTTFQGPKELRDRAEHYYQDHDLEVLDAFLALVQVAQRGWTHPSKSETVAADTGAPAPPVRLEPIF